MKVRNGKQQTLATGAKNFSCFHLNDSQIVAIFIQLAKPLQPKFDYSFHHQWNLRAIFCKNQENPVSDHLRICSFWVILSCSYQLYQIFWPLDLLLRKHLPLCFGVYYLNFDYLDFLFNFKCKFLLMAA